VPESRSDVIGLVGRRGERRPTSKWPYVVIGLVGVLFILVAIVTAPTSRFNQTTVALVLLVLVLVVSARSGLAAGVLSALLATGAFNYFFLPPTRTWVIEDPENWIALGAFLVSSVVASRLLSRATSETAAADARRGEVEALYTLSFDLFNATTRSRSLGEAVQRALELLGAKGGGLVLFDGTPSRQQIVSWTGEHTDEMEDLLAGVGRHQRLEEYPPLANLRRRDVYLPLNIAGQRGGAMAVLGTEATMGALGAAATLVSLSVERERFIAERAHLEALRESDLLKTSLLRAVSHDLNSPLTAIGLQVQSLRRIAAKDEEGELIARIEREADRLRRRIENLLAMARLEAGALRPRPEPTPPADLFRAARESLSLVVEERPLVVRVAKDCPDVYVDPTLALEVLVNLVENAHRAAPPSSPIEMVAVEGREDVVIVDVLDRGQGYKVKDEKLPDGDLPRRGLGLEIVRSFLGVSGGRLEFLARDGGGTIARVELPAAVLAGEAER